MSKRKRIVTGRLVASSNSIIDSLCRRFDITVRYRDVFPAQVVEKIYCDRQPQIIRNNDRRT